MSKIKRIFAISCMFVFLISFNLTTYATTYKYDELGRVIEVGYDSGQKITYTYDAGGNILTVTSDSPEGTLTGIILDAATYNINIDEVHNTTVTAKYSDGTQKAVVMGVVYTTSNSSIATVDATGKVTGIAKGEATITATFEGQSATTKVTVVDLGDIQAPVQPSNLEVTAKSETSVSLSWTASIDNIGVKGYYVYRDAVKIATTSKTTYINTGLIPGKMYTYSVKAYDAAGNISDESNAIEETTIADLQAPTFSANLVVTEFTERTITISWEAATDNVGIKGYELYMNGVKAKTITASTYTFIGLVPGNQYSFYVKAYDHAGNYSAESNIVTETTVADAEKPTAPSSFESTGVTETTVTLAWTASTDHVGVQGYYIFRDGTKVATTSKTFWTNTGLVPGRNYTYIVKAYDYASNISEDSNAITVTTVADPSAPTYPADLTATSITETTVTLNWTAASDNVGVKGYEIYRDGTKVGTTSKNTFTNAGLIPGKSYVFIVKAYDVVKNMSEGSNSVEIITIEDPVAPSQPVGLTASTTETTVILTWTVSTDSVGVKGYEIYRDGTKIATTNKLTYTNSKLIPGKTYGYNVRAYDVAGNFSVESDPLEVITVADPTAPTIPTLLEASSIAETSLILSWTASTDNVGVKGYYVYRDGVKISTTSKTTLTNTGLLPGKAYTYTIKAYDIAGNISEESTPLNVTTTADPTAPTIPTLLEASSIAETSLILSWTASTDNVGVKGYYVYRDGVKISTTSKTTLTNMGLLPGKAYTYTIKAYDIAGNISEESAPLIVTTIADPTAPTTPTLLEASSIAETSLILSWTASTDNVGVKGYYVYRDGIKISTTSKTTLTNTGLLPGKTYTYTIKAYDIAGNISAESAALSITTVADLQTPSSVSDLVATIASTTSVTLNWTSATDNVGVKGYEIYKDGVKIATSSKPTYTVTRLSAGKSYTFTVKTYDIAGNYSQISNAATITVQ